jgi:lipoprotein-releasing system ATP-binding protein
MPEGLRVELDQVSKIWRKDGREIRVLRALSHVLEAGSASAIVGASGAGKSTLLSLLGLLDRASSGTIRYDGDTLLGEREDVIEGFRNRNVGFVFQFHHLLPDFTALENVMMPALIAGTPLAEARRIALALLEQVGLAERTTHQPGELSGGEQQRVAIARALVRRPRLVLADEPTGNLDPATGRSIHDLLVGLHQEHGTTLLVATHNLEMARSLPRVLRLADGPAGTCLQEGLA